MLLNSVVCVGNKRSGCGDRALQVCVSGAPAAAAVTFGLVIEILNCVVIQSIKNGEPFFSRFKSQRYTTTPQPWPIMMAVETQHRQEVQE